MRALRFFLWVVLPLVAGDGFAQTTLRGGLTSAWDNTTAVSTTGGVTLNLGLGVDYLIVGGGGGGGGDNGGGGGGGGVLSGTTTVNSQNYTFTVGAGGAGGGGPSSANQQGPGLSGGNSAAFGLTAIGGGGASGGDPGSTAKNGGSGGGGDGEGVDLTGGSGTAGQGFAGGNGVSPGGGGGGGGGAGGAGSNASGGNGGNGGAGVASSITGTSLFYAGGGGGGPQNDVNFTASGGSGVGGNGRLNTGGNGMNGRGGGGGGAGWDGANALGGNGGSGAVIVRFLGGDIATGGTESTINVSGTSYRLHQFTATGSSTFAPTFAVADLQAVQSGAISGTGALNYNSAGKLILSANNTHSGGTTISAGTLQMGNGGTTGTLGSGNVTNNAALVFNRSDAVTVANAISGSGSVTKMGSNNVTLTAASSYNGNTTVSGGTLIVASGASISSSVTTVSTGAHLKVNGTAGAVNVNGTLSGSGSVGAVALNSGATLAVGNSPGLMTAASAAWNPGSTFQFEVIDATGAAGTAWDLFAATGVLDLTTISAANKMNLTVLSTALQNYDVDTMYTWTFAKAASLSGTASWISGLDVTDRFTIDSTGFNGNNQPGRGFKVVTGTDGSLATLSIQSVPEPSSGSLLILGLAAALVRSRRCRGQAEGGRRAKIS